MEKGQETATAAETGLEEGTSDRRRHTDVYVYEHGEDGPHLEPGHALVAKDGGRVRWHNLTKHDVLIVLPDGDLFTGQGSVLEVAAGASSPVLRVDPGAEKGGHLYMGIRRSSRRGPKVIKGGSDPVIIIR